MFMDDLFCSKKNKIWTYMAYGRGLDHVSAIIIERINQSTNLTSRKQLSKSLLLKLFKYRVSDQKQRRIPQKTQDNVNDFQGLFGEAH